MHSDWLFFAEKLPGFFLMYRREHRHQLLSQDFMLPFGGKFSGESRWIKLAAFIQWDDFEETYASKFCKGFGAPAKPFRMAFGALIINTRLGLSDEELVDQINLPLQCQVECSKWPKLQQNTGSLHRVNDDGGWICPGRPTRLSGDGWGATQSPAAAT